MKLYELSGLDINLHCIKSVHIQSFSGLYFPAFGLNMERFEVTRVQSECVKTESRKTLNMDTFYALLLKD